jgi:hypothetical protein
MFPREGRIGLSEWLKDGVDLERFGNANPCVPYGDAQVWFSIIPVLKGIGQRNTNQNESFRAKFQGIVEKIHQNPGDVNFVQEHGFRHFVIDFQDNVRSLRRSAR